MAYRERDDVPDELRDAHKGSTWLMWPDRRRGPWLLRIIWTRIAGRLECCGLEIRSCRDGHESWPPELPRWDEDPQILTASTLRQLALGAILSDLREEGWQRTEQWAAEIETEPASDAERELAAVFRRRARLDRGVRRRGIPPLPEVARVYRAAAKRREPPTQTVADHWNAAHSTAAKWIMRARREGYLDPADRKDRS
jgi:hypothetical protein